MARGWESKSVEEQQSEAISATDKSRQHFTADQLILKRERDGLMLTKKRLQQQLETATNPQHRKMLGNALFDVESMLAKLS